jgi:hypothetical protein
VSQVDADGNEIAGIRLPELAVPLATHTGWNFRPQDTGGSHLLVDLVGSRIPFPRTRVQREAAGDPRRSIEERYGSKDRYLALVKAAADALVAERYLLAADVDAVLRDAAERWDAAAGL